jgi:hypothetical protein
VKCDRIIALEIRERSGVIAMSSEEMRTELETFVNKGLQEGWRGWPRHDGREFPGTDKTGRICRPGRAQGTSRDFVFPESSYGSYQSN